MTTHSCCSTSAYWYSKQRCLCLWKLWSHNDRSAEWVYQYHAPAGIGESCIDTRKIQWVLRSYSLLSQKVIPKDPKQLLVSSWTAPSEGSEGFQDGIPRCQRHRFWGWFIWDHFLGKCIVWSLKSFPWGDKNLCIVFWGLFGLLWGVSFGDEIVFDAEEPWRWTCFWRVGTFKGGIYSCY